MLILLMQGITDELSCHRVSKVFIYRRRDFYVAFMQILPYSIYGMYLHMIEKEGARAT